MAFMPYMPDVDEITIIEEDGSESSRPNCPFNMIYYVTMFTLAIEQCKANYWVIRINGSDNKWHDWWFESEEDRDRNHKKLHEWIMDPVRTRI